jgi:hypothetical protein
MLRPISSKFDDVTTCTDLGNRMEQADGAICTRSPGNRKSPDADVTGASGSRLAQAHRTIGAVKVRVVGRDTRASVNPTKLPFLWEPEGLAGLLLGSAHSCTTSCSSKPNTPCQSRPEVTANDVGCHRRYEGRGCNSRNLQFAFHKVFDVNNLRNWRTRVVFPPPSHC